MRQHHLTNQNAYAIKEIARALPQMQYDTLRNLPSKQWKRNLFNFFSTLMLTGWLCKIIYMKWYADPHQVNHVRRLRRTYLKLGIVGVANYLKKQGVEHNIITSYLQDFELDSNDIAVIRKMERKHNAKLILK